MVPEVTRESLEEWLATWWNPQQAQEYEESMYWHEVLTHLKNHFGLFSLESAE